MADTLAVNQQPSRARGILKQAQQARSQETRDVTVCSMAVIARPGEVPSPLYLLADDSGIRPDRDGVRIIRDRQCGGATTERRYGCGGLGRDRLYAWFGGLGGMRCVGESRGY